MKTPTKSQENIFENQLKKMLGIDFDISQESKMARFSQIILAQYPLEKDQFRNEPLSQTKILSNSVDFFT